MDERRQLPRWQIKREVKAWLPQTEEYAVCTIEDINFKGMCASFTQRISTGNLGSMSFLFEEEGCFTKIGMYIPWTKESEGCYTYGIFFNQIKDVDKQVLEHYINQHCFQQLKSKWWE